MDNPNDQTDAPVLSKEEKRRKKAEIKEQMAKLAEQAAAFETDASDSDAASPPTKSPVRKRKSEVLAEASPVKQKGARGHCHI
jgi:hypothetical protein